MPTTIRRGPAGHGQEVAVARRGAAVGGQADVVPLAQQRQRGRRRPGRRHGGRARRRARPARRRTSSPPPRRPSRASRRRARRAHTARGDVAGGEAAQEGVGVGDLRPRRRRLDRRRRGVRRLGRDLLGGRVARRHGQAEHVGAGAGVPPGQGLAQLDDLRRQHRLGAHHATQRLEGAGVVGVARALDDVAVDVLAGEAHLDPRARDRGVGHRRRARRSRRAGRGGPARCRRGPARPGRCRRAPTALLCAGGWRPPWPWRRRRQHEAPEASRLPGLRGTSCGRLCQRAPTAGLGGRSPSRGGGCNPLHVTESPHERGLRQRQTEVRQTAEDDQPVRCRRRPSACRRGRCSPR